MEKNEQDVKIEKYKISYNSNYFKDVISSNKINGFENPFYYPDVVNSWFDFRLKELIENDYLKDRVELLTSYLNDLTLLMTNVVELYIFIDRYDKAKREVISRINIKEHDVLSILKLIRNYKTSINLNKGKGNIDLSYKIKNYCLSKFDECIVIIEDKFLINIYDSPLKTEYKKVRKSIKKSITLKEINSLINIKEKNKSNKKDNKTTKWFKVGLLFATGEIEKLKKKFNSNSTQIAKHKFKDSWGSYRPYISESISNTNKTDKNIFSSHTKILEIIKYCEENDIKMSKGFAPPNKPTSKNST